MVAWKSFVVTAALGIALAGCKQQSREAAAPVPAATVKAIPIKEFMGHVMEFSAESAWKWQGWTNDQSGEKSLFPKNEAEWEQAESASLTVAELTRLLLQPDLRMNGKDWDARVLEAHAAATEMAKAAEAHDEDALFKAGSRLDEACTACHHAYAPNLEGPATS